NNAVPDSCARLTHTVVVDSGSNRDGSSQGEDFNVLDCVYLLPAGLEVTKQCPPTPPLPGGAFTYTGSLKNTGQVDIVALTLVNDQPAPNTIVLSNITLAVNETLLFTNSYLIPTNFTNCAITDTLTATGLACSVAVSAVTRATCPLVSAPLVICPPDTTVQCFSDLPLP